MLKNESFSIPFHPLILFVILSLSNGIAQIAVRGSETAHALWCLKILEYGIGISVAASMLCGVIASISERQVSYILGTLIIILFVHMIMPVFVKSVFAVIIACVLVIVLICLAGPVVSVIVGVMAALSGVLGTLISVIFFGAMIFSSYIVGGW